VRGRRVEQQEDDEKGKTHLNELKIMLTFVVNGSLRDVEMRRRVVAVAESEDGVVLSVWVTDHGLNERRELDLRLRRVGRRPGVANFSHLELSVELSAQKRRKEKREASAGSRVEVRRKGTRGEVEVASDASIESWNSPHPPE